MFYSGFKDHGLAYDPFKAIVTPRPIGWISTLDKNGQSNLAPYSFFNAISTHPHMVAFASLSLKDSARNARDTGEFVYSLATMALIDEMNASCADLPAGVSEFEHAGIAAAASVNVKPPRVAASPAALECRTVSCNELLDIDGKATDNFLVIGQVVGVYIDDDHIKDGRFDTAAARPLARCGYRDYAGDFRHFELARPTE